MSEPIFFDSEQAWLDARRGIPTSSEIHRLCINGKRPMTDLELANRPKSGTGSKTTTIECETVLNDGALTYIDELIAEIESEPEPVFYSAEMDWGRQQEPEAVKVFAERMGISLDDPGFIHAGVNEPVFYMLSTIAGGSPDIIMTDAIGEVKCPKSKTHVKYLLMDEAAVREQLFEYWCQMQFNMVLAKKSLCYFISFDPRFKNKELQLKVIEIHADVEFQAYMLRRVQIAHEKKLEKLALINQAA